MISTKPHDLGTLKKQKEMKTNEKGQLIPVKELKDGVWMRPERAIRFFHNQKSKGKGIAIGTLQNKIKGMRLRGLVKYDHTGPYIWVPNDAINAKQDLEAA